MADYAITCSTKEHPHRHITSIGNSSYTWSVRQAYAAMDQGNTFHTGSNATRDYATVAKYNCSECNAPTLRTHADGRWNNNLDNLTSC